MKLWRQTEFCDLPEAYLWFRLDRGHSGGPVSRSPVSRTLHPGRDTSHRSGVPRDRGRTRQGSSALRWSRRQSNSLRSAGRSCPPCSCRAHRVWRLRLQGPSVWTRLSIARRNPPRILEGSCRSGPSEPGHHLHAEPTPAARCQGNHVLTRQSGQSEFLCVSCDWWTEPKQVNIGGPGGGGDMFTTMWIRYSTLSNSLVAALRPIITTLHLHLMEELKV